MIQKTKLLLVSSKKKQRRQNFVNDKDLIRIYRNRGNLIYNIYRM